MEIGDIIRNKFLQRLIRQVKEAETQGWKLCVGCIHQKYDDTNSPCQTCPIETRKLMGYKEEGNEETKGT